jgi:hypothetical protein
VLPLAQANCFDACRFHRNPQGVPDAALAPPHSTLRPNAIAALFSPRGAFADNGGGKYSGQFSWPSIAQNITVRSSLGISATTADNGFSATVRADDAERVNAQLDAMLAQSAPLAVGDKHRVLPRAYSVPARLNGNARYRQLFGALFPSVAAGGPIDFTMFGPCDRRIRVHPGLRQCAYRDKFAGGPTNAISTYEERGALIFFGKGNCANRRSSTTARSRASKTRFATILTCSIGMVVLNPERALPRQLS